MKKLLVCALCAMYLQSATPPTTTPVTVDQNALRERARAWQTNHVRPLPQKDQETVRTVLQTACTFGQINLATRATTHELALACVEASFAAHACKEMPDPMVKVIAQTAKTLKKNQRAYNETLAQLESTAQTLVTTKDTPLWGAIKDVESCVQEYVEKYVFTAAVREKQAAAIEGHSAQLSLFLRVANTLLHAPQAAAEAQKADKKPPFEGDPVELVFNGARALLQLGAGTLLVANEVLELDGQATAMRGTVCQVYLQAMDEK